MGYFIVTFVVSKDTTVDSPFEAVPCEPKNVEHPFCGDKDQIPHHFLSVSGVSECSELEYSRRYKSMFL